MASFYFTLSTPVELPPGENFLWFELSRISSLSLSSSSYNAISIADSFFVMADHVVVKNVIVFVEKGSCVS